MGRADRSNYLFGSIPEAFGQDFVRQKRIATGDLAVRPILARYACGERTRRQQRRSRRTLGGGFHEQSGDRID
jgi:hypothetical protein